MRKNKLLGFEYPLKFYNSFVKPPSTLLDDKTLNPRCVHFRPLVAIKPVLWVSHQFLTTSSSSIFNTTKLYYGHRGFFYNSSTCLERNTVIDKAFPFDGLRKKEIVILSQISCFKPVPMVYEFLLNSDPKKINYMSGNQSSAFFVVVALLSFRY